MSRYLFRLRFGLAWYILAFHLLRVVREVLEARNEVLVVQVGHRAHLAVRLVNDLDAGRH
jgi:hypothetical protein